MVDRFESIGERTAALSDAMLHEVEEPVRAVLAVARGVRYGTRRFMERMTRRFTDRSANNGGTNYE